jgi:hypothetical protein
VGSSANVASAAVILDASNNDVTGNYVISYVDGSVGGDKLERSRSRLIAIQKCTMAQP